MGEFLWEGGGATVWALHPPRDGSGSCSGVRVRGPDPPAAGGVGPGTGPRPAVPGLAAPPGRSLPGVRRWLETRPAGTGGRSSPEGTELNLAQAWAESACSAPPPGSRLWIRPYLEDR